MNSLLSGSFLIKFSSFSALTKIEELTAGSDEKTQLVFSSDPAVSSSICFSSDHDPAVNSSIFVGAEREENLKWNVLFLMLQWPSNGQYCLHCTKNGVIRIGFQKKLLLLTFNKGNKAFIFEEGIPVKNLKIMNHLKTPTTISMETKVVLRDSFFGQACRKTLLEWILRWVTGFLLGWLAGGTRCPLGSWSPPKACLGWG